MKIGPGWRGLCITLSTIGLAACAPATPAVTLPPLTRVVSVDTLSPQLISPAPPTLAPAAMETALPASPTAPLPTVSPPPTLTASPMASATSTPTFTPTRGTVGPVRLMAVGDVMLGRAPGELIERDGPAGPFTDVVPLLAEADVLAANLECALSDQGEPQPKAYTFRAPTAAAETLALAGVDVVSLANNHALDYGPAALTDTLHLLAAHGIAAAGAGLDAAAARAPALIERNGLRMAFLAYVDVLTETRTGFDTRAWIATDLSPGVAWADLDHLRADVAAAKTQADVVIVLLHFGLENRTQVVRDQRAAARAAIEAGAALVLGAHPHVLQGVEEYQGGLIVYSLGNFIFDGFDPAGNNSAIFSATLTWQGVSDYTWLPVKIDTRTGFPRPATAEEARHILPLVQPLVMP